MKQYNVKTLFKRIVFDIARLFSAIDSGINYILVVIAYFTKRSEAFALPNQEVVTTSISIQVDKWICRYGIFLCFYTVLTRINYLVYRIQKYARAINVGCLSGPSIGLNEEY